MSDKNTPLISVIIAVYNPGKYLRACLDSIVNQTYKNLEIILVDDGSTDDSLAVCNEYAEKDSRVIVFHKENSGVSATRNKGIELSHGDYYSFIDSDDYIELDTYEYLIDIINKHNVDAVTFEHYITFPAKEHAHTIPDEEYGLKDNKGSMSHLVRYFPFACNKLFSKKLIDGLTFKEGIARGEDSLFTRQAFSRAESTWFDKRPLYHYIQSEESAVRGKFRKSQLTCLQLIGIYEEFCKEKYPELYDVVMCQFMNLITMLYIDMRNDKEDFRAEEKMVIEEFRKLYEKADMSHLGTNRKSQLRTFRFSPGLFYFIKKLRSPLRR